MLEQGGGAIVNTGSIASERGLAGACAYNATKHGILGLTRTAAADVAARGVRVNAVAPGPTKTDLFLEGKPQELIERISKLAPLERLGTVEDTARVVAFLVGEEGAWVNGQVLRVNGGMI